MTFIAAFLLQASGGGLAFGLLPMVAIFAVFYFLLIMPQSRRQKAWQKMVNELQTGDKVVTSGGMRGTIVTIKDDSVYLKLPPDGLRVEVAKTAVTGVAKPDDAAN